MHVQVPLSVLVLASEVRVGLWRRNGHVMVDQVVNYAEAPFCRVFRDMDLLLVQVAGESTSNSFFYCLSKQRDMPCAIDIGRFSSPFPSYLSPSLPTHPQPSPSHQTTWST